MLKVNTLALTKPEKAQMVENHLVQLARSGQIMGKVNFYRLEKIF